MQPHEFDAVVQNFPPRSLESVKQLRDTLLTYCDAYPVRAGAPAPRLSDARAPQGSRGRGLSSGKPMQQRMPRERPGSGGASGPPRTHASPPFPPSLPPGARGPLPPPRSRARWRSC
jgi:hypothetical protein